MRAQLFQAVTLVAALFAIGPLVSPAVVSPGELAYHVGQRVEVVGHVVNVEPSGSVWQVTVEGSGGSVVVLERGSPPVLGSEVRVVGDASTDRDGAVLWARAWSVVSAPDGDPRGVAWVAEVAPRLEGSVVSVVGVWEEQEALRERGASLPVHMRSARPPVGERIVAWGVLGYDVERAGYGLQAVGWELWTPARR